MKIALNMTGCRNNRYELDQILHWAIKNKIPVVKESEADYVVINTCTVTSTADKKSRQLIRRTRNQNPKLKTIVFGCAARMQKEAFEKMMEVDHLFDNLNEVITFLESQLSDMKQCDEPNLIVNHSDFTRCRALVQIQDGCDNFCSYCIIAPARGRSKSRPQEEILSEIKQHVANGFNEVVLTGINIGAYGARLTTRPQENKFAELIEAILEKTQIKRLRASSLGPEFFNEKWLKVMKNPRFMQHFHLSIQSGSDSVLQRMRRNYTVKQVETIIQQLRKSLPDVSITADIIAGFPGETDKEFEETLEFLKRNKLAKVHIFPYSERKETAAAKMEQVPVKLRRERAKRLQELADRHREAFIKNQIGKKAEVLWEHSRKPGWKEGVTSNYIRIRMKGSHCIRSISEEILTEKNMAF